MALLPATEIHLAYLLSALHWRISSAYCTMLCGAIGKAPVSDYHYSVPDQILDRFLRGVVKQDNIRRG